MSGKISVPAYVQTDSDINDSYAPSRYHISNNSCGLAQSLPNPAIVAGYVNQPYTGSSGSSYATGDTTDYYQVYLAAGEQVELYIYAEPSVATNPNLNLQLLRSNCSTQEAISNSSEAKREVVQAATSGTYYIKVTAAAGAAANYHMLVGTDAATSSLYAASAKDDFVAGELIVRYKSAAADSVLGIQSKSVDTYGLRQLSGEAGRGALLQLGEGDEARKTAGLLGIQLTAAAGAFEDPTLRLKNDTLKVARALRFRPEIASVDLNYIRRSSVAMVPTDPDYALNQWNFQDASGVFGFESAWGTATNRGAGVRVAVIDTGVLMSHPDLDANICASCGYDFIASAANGDGDGIDNNPNDLYSYHGTHVAGIIAAETDNGEGVAGSAFNATIMPLRTLSDAGGTDYDLMQAIRYAAGLSNDSNIILSASARADIINMSLGGTGYSDAFQQTILEARARGVIIIAAAGNEATSTKSYPAAYQGVVAVSAFDNAGNLASYSNYGDATDMWVDVAAPGGDTGGLIYSTFGTGAGTAKYAGAAGTSMASPHVAGMAALMKGECGGIGPAVFDSLLSGLQITDGAGKTATLGYGRIDPASAANWATTPANCTTKAAAVNLIPGSIKLAGSSDTAYFLVENSGTTAMSVSSVSDNQSWLSVSAVDVDSNGLGLYRLRLDRSKLGSVADLSKATITVNTDTGGSKTLPVRVFGSTQAGRGGYFYLYLMNAQTGAVSAEEVDTSTGDAQFNFNYLSSGYYYLYYGTDMNNDYQFCDLGDVCRYYQDGAAINVNGPVTGIELYGGVEPEHVITGYSLTKDVGVQ